MIRREQKEQGCLNHTGAQTAEPDRLTPPVTDMSVTGGVFSIL